MKLIAVLLATVLGLAMAMPAGDKELEERGLPTMVFAIGGTNALITRGISITWTHNALNPRRPGPALLEALKAVNKNKELREKLGPGPLTTMDDGNITAYTFDKDDRLAKVETGTITKRGDTQVETLKVNYDRRGNTAESTSAAEMMLQMIYKNPRISLG